jgi:hypothetical protein
MKTKITGKNLICSQIPWDFDKTDVVKCARKQKMLKILQERDDYQ